jgi:hypothetical protein
MTTMLDTEKADNDLTIFSLERRSVNIPVAEE